MMVFWCFGARGGREPGSAGGVPSMMCELRQAAGFVEVEMEIRLVSIRK